MSRSRRRPSPEAGGSGRWSARRKMETVLRLLQGEDLDALVSSPAPLTAEARLSRSSREG